MGCIRYYQILSIYIYITIIISIYHYNGPSPYLIFNPYIPRIEARVAAAPKIGAGLTGQRASQETRVLLEICKKGPFSAGRCGVPGLGCCDVDVGGAREIFSWSSDEKKLLGPRIQVCMQVICYMIILFTSVSWLRTSCSCKDKAKNRMSTWPLGQKWCRHRLLVFIHQLNESNMAIS